ncbi:hypothetical protein SA2016_2163 [Sinomonas atrocyanea]|uniref:Uncharacterized protein n=2 Tax=Sinomonas atrocyanea TaxID=37927 RepID=A0A127A5C7_9MICC|nr:hypothetical protein [Sinomonas atrocyanea]AMM32832.1 hypothetical protein SA2016_2163 [Sinomonas atrocyanea]GEB65645.1 hypothetical protein SAT01_30930 [Sinomonas atrocyanea]GGG69192.1 hypothetical protein GCM10007172_21590 [Sinomonas atrocyanea]
MVGVVVSSGVGVGGPGRISLSDDGGATWKDATIDGQPATEASLERLVAGPAGWLALGRTATAQRDRLAVFTSADGRAYAQSGEGIAIPEGGTVLAAGTTSGWTVMFRKDEAPWQVATSADGIVWDVGTASSRGLAFPGELFLNDLASSGRELMVVGQNEIPSSSGGTAISSVIARSTDAGLTWKTERPARTEYGSGYNDGLRAATWSPQGFAAVGWAWVDPGTTAPQAAFLRPRGSSGLVATLETALRDGTQRNQGADTLEESEGAYLAAGNDGEPTAVTQSLRVGTPGSWKTVSLPGLPEHTHRFAAGNVAVPGGFLSFHDVSNSLTADTEVYYVEPSGKATLRSSIPAPSAPTTELTSIAPVGTGIEALGHAGAQAAVFRRSEGGSFGSPTLLPSDPPVRFGGLRAAEGARLLFGQRQLSTSTHGVAWTSTDGSQWNTGSEAVLSPGPQDKTVIRDGLVAQGTFFVAGEVDDRQGTVSGAIAVRGHDDMQWTRPSTGAFAGTKGTSVTVRRLAEAPDGSIIAIGTATTAGTARLKAWRSTGGSAFAEVPVPAAPEGTDRTVGGLVRVGTRLALSVTDELADRTRRVAVYESSDSGATWSAAPHDALEGNEPIATDLASDGEDAVLVATVGTRTRSHAAALRRGADGAWRALGLDSRALASGSTTVLDSALSGGHLVISAETGPAAERRGAVVDIPLPDRP